MYLVDTNVISEARKGAKAAQSVIEFFQRTEGKLFLPVQVVGELECGVEILRRRGDLIQAELLAAWVEMVLEEYSSSILAFDVQSAKIWGALRGANKQNPMDKQIAAIALHYGMVVATRNTRHFLDTGVALFNPFIANLPEEPN